MLRNIALTATGLVFCLIMVFYLLNAPDRAARSIEIAAVAPASVVAPAEIATELPAPTVTAAPVAGAVPTPTPVPTTEEATATPTPAAMETEIARIFEDNNRGLDVPVRVSRMMDVITIRWALSDREPDAIIAEADRRIGEVLPVLGNEYRLINFEGTFSLVYADGRRSEDVVLWVTYEDGREVSRKVAPVLGRE
jgi:hypothetical protein